MTGIPPDLAAALADRYRLTGEVGAGGMAQVFRATDVKHGREVAIKVVRPGLAALQGVERFEREIAVAARLSHPHLVPLFDSGAVGEHHYYVMPFVLGESLRGRLDREGRIPVAEALRLTRDLATGLAHAHAAGILHRDIKPENVLLAGRSPMLADFGIALPFLDAEGRLTSTGMAPGTLFYMSPEQLAGDRALDQRSDLYSLGAVLFEMVTGSPPHGPAPPAQMLGRRLAGPPDGLETGGGVPAPARPVLRRLLATDPAARYPSAEALVEALDTAVVEAGGAAGRRRPRALAAAAIGVVAVAGGAALLLPRPATAPAGPAARPLTQVAVLPFSSLGGDQAGEYFSDGLGEELIHTLSRVEGLRVVPRTSSWAFKGRSLDVRALGDSLDAGAIVEGGVRQGGDRLRVTARLIRTADGQALWSGEFDERSRADVFAIQDSIARAIVAAIRPRLVGDGPAGGDPTPTFLRTRSVAAHDLYLRARFEWNRRSAAGALRAVDLFREATRADSGYAAAWAGLAEALAVAAFYEWLPPAQAFPEARRLARHALALDPGAGEPHATLGYVALWHDWDLPAAETEFQRAIRLRPRYAQARQWYANLLTAAGRFEEARAAWREAVALEPLAMIMVAAPGWTEFYAGRPDRTVAIEEAALARDSTFVLAHYWLGLGRIAQGDAPGALAAFQRAAELSGGALARTGIAHAHAVAGRADSARAVMAALARAAPPPPAVEMAAVHLALGDTAAALGWLERAQAARSHSIALAPIDPRLAALRGNPRFERLLGAVRR
jgi:eukaryotic-like serine/threonine-protein kinase